MFFNHDIQSLFQAAERQNVGRGIVIIVPTINEVEVVIAKAQEQDVISYDNVELLFAWM